MYNFKPRFKWAILKMKAKMTLLQFFGHISLSYGPISKFKNRLTAEDLRYQFMALWMLFGALGEYRGRRFWCSGSLRVKVTCTIA